jgi:hypothetical protein
VETYIATYNILPFGPNKEIILGTFGEDNHLLQGWATEDLVASGRKSGERIHNEFDWLARSIIVEVWIYPVLYLSYLWKAIQYTSAHIASCCVKW